MPSVRLVTAMCSGETSSSHVQTRPQKAMGLFLLASCRMQQGTARQRAELLCIGTSVALSGPGPGSARSGSLRGRGQAVTEVGRPCCWRGALLPHRLAECLASTYGKPKPQPAAAGARSSRVLTFLLEAGGTQVLSVLAIRTGFAFLLPLR